MAKGALKVNCPRSDKVAYASRELAVRSIDRMIKLGNSGLEAYLCSCENWHIGHSNDSLTENLIKRIGWSIES